MFVIDEAGSVPRAVAVTAQAALASGIECKLIIGGKRIYHFALWTNWR